LEIRILTAVINHKRILRVPCLYTYVLGSARLADLKKISNPARLLGSARLLKTFSKKSHPVLLLGGARLLGR
jgi:hypothetical protein